MIEKLYKPRKSFEPSTRSIMRVNTKINRFKDFTEFIYYKNPFDVLYGKKEYWLIDTATGKLVSNREIGKIRRQQEKQFWGNILEVEYDTERALHESSRRAKDNFYGYALCNDWNYFCTFTISKNEHAHDDTATKLYWKQFRERLQYHHPEIKILAVPERHDKGNLHFHALIGNCDLTNLLTIATNKKTGKRVKWNGRHVYNLGLWDKGFSTVVQIDKSITENKLKAINYLIEYVTIENNIGYNQKKYYRTNNLQFKQSELTYTHNPDNILEKIDYGSATLHKDNKKIRVVREWHKKK